MPILRGYSFDSGQLQVPALDSVGWGCGANAKTGAYCCLITSGDPRWIRFPIAGNPANPSVSVWVDPSPPGFNSSFQVNGLLRLQFVLNTGEYIELRLNTVTYTLDAYVNNVNVANGTITLVDDWFHVQFYVVIDDAPNGHIYVKLNGHVSIDYAGDTKVQAGTTGVTFFRSQGGDYSARRHSIDDLVIGTAGYLGDLRCVDIRPTADTALDDWTPSAGGDNYAMVDEVSTNAATIDADYNKAGIDGDADELALGDFDGATYVPVAVTAWCRAQQLAANGDSIKIGIDSAGTEAETTWPLSNTMEYYFHTSDQNPADAAEWEDADIDALLVRYEAVIV